MIYRLLLLLLLLAVNSLATTHAPPRRHLRFAPCGIDTPASCVDPFWACERTNLPEPVGIAAMWYWPKALAGNTHPGASLPHGMVSVTAFSGAYPSGYGVSGHGSRGMPSSAQSASKYTHGNYSSVPYQYNALGFAHFQPSGTGSIGQYMNFLLVSPLGAQTPAEFLLTGSHVPRSTLLGERAVAGTYSGTLGELGVRATVTTAEGVALHRSVCTTSWCTNHPGHVILWC